MKTKLLKKIRKRYEVKFSSYSCSCILFDLKDEKVKNFVKPSDMYDYLFTENVSFFCWSRFESLEVIKFVLKRRNRIVFKRMLREKNL